MTDIVTPKVVRNASPAPLTSDPPQIFDDKCIALASWYQGFIDDFNLATGHTNQNAQATHEFADAVQLLWQQVQDGVITIQQAMAAIQAGPVVSVMGRSGVVTGLVEAASGSLGTAAMSTAPLGQWASFSSTGTAGGDWPTSQGTAWWNVFTFGASNRKTQIAVQAFSNSDQSGMFIRSQHDSTWSAWQRFLGDRSLLERGKYVSAPGSAYTAYSSEASLHYLDINAALTINVGTARQFGDQLTIMLSFVSAQSIVFSSNVKAPVGGIRSGVAGHILTVTLVARQDGTWHAYDGGLHPW